VPFSGGDGAVLTYRPNGTAVTNFNRSKPEVATVGGVRWRYVIRGTVTMNVHHDRGMEYISRVRAKGTIDLYRGSRRDNRIPLSLILKPVKYVCSDSDDTARFLSPDNPTEWARVR
jgi:hypothetical protein